MNVLFAGRANITASYLADRFYREGHSVFWVTSQEHGLLWSKEFKGRVYRQGYGGEELRRIFTLHGIDTVIFAGESYPAQESGGEEKQTQIFALQNILAVSASAKPAHFVYLSSAELDCRDADSPGLAELQYGEAICGAFHKKTGIPMLMLRLGLVYGNYPLEEMGYMGESLMRAMKGQTVEWPYTDGSLVDMIYGEDAAVAANNLLAMDCQGLYHIITGHPVTMPEFQSCLEHAVGRPVQMSCTETENGMDRDSCRRLSQKVKQDTGWVPFYLLGERGSHVLARSVDSHCIEKRKNKTDKKKSPLGELRRIWHRFPNLKGVLEALALFFVMSWILPLTQGATDFRYVDVRLLYIAMVSVMFGMRIGLFATALACFSYAFGLRREGIDLTFLLYSVETWIPFIIYGIAGSLLGYMSDRKNDAIEESEEKFGNLWERYTFLKGVHKEALEVKGRLQQQISSSKESFGKMYEVTEQLNTLDPERVFFHAVDVITETVGDCHAAIWLINPAHGHYARRKACSRELRDRLPNSLDMEDYPLLRVGFEDENMYVNRELHEEYPDYAAPVYHNKMIIAFAAVYDLDAEKFTLYYQNLFKVLVGLTENSLVRAMEYEEKRKDERYIQGTRLLNPGEFAQQLSLMEEEKEKAHITYLQLELCAGEKASLPEISEAIQGLIRDNDFAGVDEEGGIRIVLANAREKDFAVIAGRFQAKGLEAVIW